MPVRKIPEQVPFPVLVSQTGRWVLPAAKKDVTVDSRGGWNARASLGRELALRDEETLEKVWSAVGRAARERTPSAIMPPARHGAPGALIMVRPAREAGFAVITRQRVDLPAPPPPAQVLTELFRLTPVEAIVATCLLRGDELSSIAAARGTSLETVRGHVKSLLRKTGRSSQKQLTAMLSRIGTLAAPEGAGASA
jgi:DNA-binding CsgD family transcriptional regulator